jgi:hypothetical protein
MPKQHKKNRMLQQKKNRMLLKGKDKQKKQQD